MALLFRSLVFAATLYLTLFVVLWAFQSNFIYPAPQSPALANSNYDEVELQTSDGLTLRAFYRPANVGFPTIVYFHGNGGTLDAASISNGVLVKTGLGILLPEYRGYGGNPGDPSEEGFYRDGEAAMAWLAETGIAPADTIIVGNSIGGGVATEMAVRHDPAALVLVAPFTSLPDAAADNIWWLPTRSLVRDQYRNDQKIAELDLPILIQHGDRDSLVTYDHGKRLAELARAAEFQTFEGSGHMLTFERRSQEARRDWILALERD